MRDFRWIRLRHWFLVVALLVGLMMTACSSDAGDTSEGDPWEFDDQDEEDAGESVDQGFVGDQDAEVFVDAAEPDEPPNQQDEPEPDPITECEGEEVDLSQDDAHCGECGNSCDPEFGQCVDGECGCPDGFEACGSDNRCEYVDQEPNHCGGCGIECGPGETCQDGECVCRAGFERCEGNCVDTSRDPDHCGGCGDDCGFGHCADGECGSGGCPMQQYFECEAPWSDGVACMPWSGATNSLYCGMGMQDPCGVSCGGDQVCAGGFNSQCVDYRAARGCESCDDCDDCGSGEECVDDIPSMDGVYCYGAPDGGDDDDDDNGGDWWGGDDDDDDDDGNWWDDWLDD